MVGKGNLGQVLLIDSLIFAISVRCEIISDGCVVMDVHGAIAIKMFWCMDIKRQKR